MRVTALLEFGQALLIRLVGWCSQVVKLKAAFQQHIREAEALKLELGRAEETLRAATGAH
jgi:hypothetical protein